MIPNPRQGKTLVLCPIGLGNFIMATPALKALSDAVGKDRVSLLALKSGIGDMARASNLFGRVFEWDPDGEGLGKGISLLREVRAEKFTHSVALFPASHWKFTAFHRLAGSAFRMGFAYPNQKAPEWIQHISLPLTDTHDTLQNLKLVETFLGTAIQNATDPFFPSDVKSPERLPSMPFFARVAARRSGPSLILARRVLSISRAPCPRSGRRRSHSGEQSHRRSSIASLAFLVASRTACPLDGCFRSRDRW